MYMLVDILCVEHGNYCPQQFMIKRIYPDVMYCKIDAGDRYALFPVSSQRKASQSNVLIIWISCFKGQLL